MKPIPGFPDYSVDERGDVWSSKIWRGRTEQRRLKPWLHRDGYFCVDLFVNGKAHSLKVHRLVLLAFAGNPEAGQECRHLDGNRQNNSPSNLCWGTAIENQGDRLIHGTDSRGVKNPGNKLNPKEVLEILELSRCGQGNTSIAKKYGISHATVRKIKSGKLWGHLTGIEIVTHK